jgi:hypothetical protein
LWNLPPGAAASARWVAIASAIATSAAISATSTTTVAASRCSAVASASVATRSGSASPTASTATEASTGAASTTSKATNVTVGATGSAATTSATATTTAPEARAFASNGFEERGNLLVGLLEQVDELADNATVAAIEESGRDTSVSGTASTADTMDVVVDVGRQIVVDNVGDIGNIFMKG